MQHNRPGKLRTAATLLLLRTLIRIGRVLTPSGPCLEPAPGRPPPLPQPKSDSRLERLSREFSREMYAHLLHELPDYREKMAQAFAAGDYQRLHSIVHQITGAVAYCDASELEQELRRLLMALRLDNHHVIAAYHARVIDFFDATIGAARSGS